MVLAAGQHSSQKQDLKAKVLAYSHHDYSSPLKALVHVASIADFTLVSPPKHSGDPHDKNTPQGEEHPHSEVCHTI